MAVTVSDLKRHLQDVADGAPWAAALAADAPALARAEAFLGRLPADVQDALRARLTDGERSAAGVFRASVWALGLLTDAGCTPLAARDGTLFELRAPGGKHFLVAPLSFGVPAVGAGRTDDLRRLTRALDAAVDGQRYALWLRKPLPSGFDPGGVAHAVRLWRLSVLQSGDAGRCASYEDERVSLEICLLDLPRRDGGSGNVVMVGPKRALERISEVDARLVTAVAEADEADRELAVLAVCGADGPWRLPRGFVHQVLYGTPRELFSEREGDTTRYEARFLANGSSLFSDPLSKRLSAVWWCAPGASGPLSAEAAATENPWRSVEGPPGLPGLRFEVVEGPSGPDRAARLRWTGGERALWAPQ